MLTLADRVIEYLMRGNDLLHVSFKPYHPHLKFSTNLLINDIRKAVKYVIGEDLINVHEEGTIPFDSTDGLLKLVPLAVPKTNVTWVEKTYKYKGETVRDGMLFVRFQTFYGVTIFHDRPDGPLDTVDYTPFTLGISMGSPLPMNPDLDEQFFDPQYPHLSRDDMRAIFTYAIPLPVHYFFDPILVRHDRVDSDVHQSILYAVRKDHDQTVRHISNVLHVMSVINTVPLIYEDVHVEGPFRPKGKAQKIPRLRGIQRVSVSLSKGMTVKRYINKALREHITNTGITKGEHMVREHDRVYHRGTDKEYSIKVKSHRRGDGELKTERRFIITS